MILHDEAYYESRKPIPNLGPMKNFLRFIWDGERRAFLDRTAQDWAYVGLFYLCFFGALFTVFAIQMWATLEFISGMERPYMQHSSRSGDSTLAMRSFFHTPFMRHSNPGLGFTPNIQAAATVPRIWLSQDHEKAMPQRYIRAIKNLLDDYNTNQSNYDLNCSDGLSSRIRRKPCFFDIKTLGKCSQLPYGYSEPYELCVYIKFNKKFDWIPIPYNQSSLLPEHMPDDLKAIVRRSEKLRIWLSCDGATNSDKEHLGPIDYFPERGFPIYYFPFTGHTNYLSPIVALNFHNLTANRLITVECYTWAENIHQEHVLDFQILID